MNWLIFGHFQGYKKSDVIGIMLPNSPTYLLVVTGAIGAGLTVTTINPSYTPQEVARQLKMSNAKVLLTNKALLQVANDAAKLLSKCPIKNAYECVLYN